MRVRLIATVAVAAAFAVPALLAAPARAASGPGTGVTCTAGSSCVLELEKLVTYSGNAAGGDINDNAFIDFTPPPCLWLQQGNAHVGSQVVIGFYNGIYSGEPPADTPYDGKAKYDQAKQLVNSNPITPGEWYMLPVNPDASAAGQAECFKLPLYYFATPATPLPGLNVPPETLAKLAFARLQTATLNNITLNPTGDSDTNLPTFLSVGLVPPPGGLQFHNGQPYVAATANLLNGQETATVWSVATGLTITPGGPAQVRSNCRRVGDTDTLGSLYSQAQMNNTGVHGAFDCGVKYTSPGTFQLQVSIAWSNACWAQGTAPDWNNCTPVPNGQLNPVNAVQPVNVREIQSVNVPSGG